MIHLLAADWGPTSELGPFELVVWLAPFLLFMLGIIGVVVLGRKHRTTRERERQEFQKLYPTQQYPHRRRRSRWSEDD